MFVLYDESINITLSIHNALNMPYIEVVNKTSCK